MYVNCSTRFVLKASSSVNNYISELTPKGEHDQYQRLFFSRGICTNVFYVFLNGIVFSCFSYGGYLNELSTSFTFYVYLFGIYIDITLLLGNLYDGVIHCI